MPKLKVAVFFLTVAATAHAEWTILSADSESGRTGIVHRHLVLEDAQTKESATIDLALFSTKSCTLRVIDQPAPQRSDLTQVMRQKACFAGVNGGYFDPNLAPIGLLVADGKIIAPLQKAQLLTGVLISSSCGVQILRIREFSREQKLNASIQCGPFLVDLGQPVHGLEDSRSARRTFAATGTNGRVELGVCSEISLAKLAKILATTRLANDLKIQRSLNLDGGSSSAFWFARKNGSAFSIPEEKPVRDFVAVVPR